jgi:hypothetical protein
MFFNSLNGKLKKMYRALNPQFKDFVFPRGEKEFIYVGTMLDLKFPGKDLVKLIQIYASVYSYYGSTTGNAAKTYVYAKKKCAGILTDDQTLTLLGIVSVSTVALRISIPDPVAAVDEYKGYAKNYINTVEVIAANPDVFATKKFGAGKRDNPILVDGVEGARKYIESLDCSAYTFGLTSVKYSKTSSMYLTDNKTGLSYAIDEYTIKADALDTEIQKLWFNIYGTENYPRSPYCLSFKEGSPMAIQEQELEAAEANDAKQKRDDERKDKTAITAENLAKEIIQCSKDAVETVITMCNQLQIAFNVRNLVLTTFAYVYATWIFNYKDINGYEEDELSKHYKEMFVQFNRSYFEESSFKEVLENEELIGSFFKKADRVIRDMYHAHNRTFVDDGLTATFTTEFLENIQEVEKIGKSISDMILKGWAVQAVELGKKTYVALDNTNSEPQEETKKPKFCGYCGAELVSGAQFCGKCGKPIYKETKNP